VDVSWSVPVVVVVSVDPEVVPSSAYTGTVPKALIANKARMDNEMKNARVLPDMVSLLFETKAIK
jgi:hypothetical protein